MRNFTKSKIRAINNKSNTIANLKGLTYEEKRFALEALQIRVLVDGETLQLEGVIPMANQSIVSQSSR